MKFCRNAVCRVAAAWLLLSLCFANSYAQGASVFFGVRTVIFGIVTDGTTAKQMLIITNTDSVGWVHGHVGAPSKSVFAISGSDTFSIGPGQKDTTYFTFSPVDVSILRDSVWITHDAWLGLGVTNPQKIVLTGQGLSPNDSSAQLKLGGFGGTTIPWSLQVDSSALRPFAFRNVSANPARHLYGTISGIHEPFGFGIGTPNFDLPDSAWDTIQFAFSPTSVGTFRDTLVMTSNATPPNNLIKIYLSGVATARTGSMPDAAITSTFIQFLGDSVGTFTQQFTVLVNPSVEAPLHITVAHTPNPPFTVSGQQSILDTLKADTILFSFAPTKGGKFTDSLVLLTDAPPPHNHIKINLSGTALSSSVATASIASGIRLTAVCLQNSELARITMGGVDGEHVTLRLYDESGAALGQLFEGIAVPDGTDLNYSIAALPYGVYFLRLECAHGIVSTKMNVRR